MSTAGIYRSLEGERAVMAFYDRLLARWPAPHDDLHVDTRVGDTFVIASGEKGAPPVVLLHGSSSNALMWAGDVQEYSRCFRVYAIDLPGEPGRSTHNRPSWDGLAFVDWLDDVLDGVGVGRTEKAALVGVSQGAWTAVKYAINRPERVAALALLAPGGIAAIRLSFVLRAIPLSMLGRRGAEALNRITFGRQAVHPDALAFMNLIMTHFRPRIGKERLFSDQELQHLEVPVMLIAGARDALRPSAKSVARMQRVVPHLTPILLSEAGHVLVDTAPSIAPFLASAMGR